MKRSTCLLALNLAGRNQAARIHNDSQSIFARVGITLIFLFCLFGLVFSASVANGQDDGLFSLKKTQSPPDITIFGDSNSTSSNSTKAAARNSDTNPRLSPAIRDLIAIEQKVQKVAAANMEACVAITDGIGFGTGVIVKESGLVLTAGHVMTTGGRRWEVIFPSGKKVPCRPLGKNLNVDAGMVQINDPGPWPTVELSRKIPRKGDWDVSLGHSGGFELGRNPPIRTGKFISVRQGLIVTDAVLIGGDSGGPLFNLDGELIGIHSSIGENVAENRHVPIQTFIKHWRRMLNSETWGALPELDAPEDALRKTRKGKLGITMDRSAPNALIKAVSADSAAGRMGVKVGDVVVELDGTQITNSGQLIDLIKKKRATEVCSLLVVRNGGYFRFEIELMAARN